jgi:hypothetical protein
LPVGLEVKMKIPDKFASEVRRKFQFELEKE